MSAIEAMAPAEFQSLLLAIERSPIHVPDLAVSALAQIRRGVMTGEGPTAGGRVHYSRTIDTTDAEYCSRILTGAGGERGAPVSRGEADLLMSIDTAAGERHDGGRFDDLLAKAVAHYALSASGQAVPPRPLALAPETSLADWVARPRPLDPDTEVLEWLAGHARRRRRGGTLMSLFVAFGGAAIVPLATSIVSVIDFAA
jgi:hypothetical protein